MHVTPDLTLRHLLLERAADTLDDIAPADLSNEVATELIQRKKEGPKPLGMHPTEGLPVYLRRLSAPYLVGAIGHLDRRRDSYTQRLLRRLLEGVRSSCVLLSTPEGPSKAWKLYRRVGFQEVGRRVGYYLKPDGSRATALTMSRPL